MRAIDFFWFLLYVWKPIRESPCGCYHPLSRRVPWGDRGRRTKDEGRSGCPRLQLQEERSRALGCSRTETDC